MDIDINLFAVDILKILVEKKLKDTIFFIDRASNKVYFYSENITYSMNEIFGNVKKAYIAINGGDIRFTDVKKLVEAKQPYSTTQYYLYPILIELENGNMVLIDSTNGLFSVQKIALDME